MDSYKIVECLQVKGIFRLFRKYAWNQAARVNTVVTLIS